MNELVSLAGAIAILWIALIGGCFIIQRRDWAATLIAWPFRTSLRLTRWAIGGLLVALGNAIRGGGQQQNRRRH